MHAADLLKHAAGSIDSCCRRGGDHGWAAGTEKHTTRQFFSYPAASLAATGDRRQVRPVSVFIVHAADDAAASGLLRYSVLVPIAILWKRGEGSAVAGLARDCFSLVLLNGNLKNPYQREVVDVTVGVRCHSCGVPRSYT